jgi:signal peptidase II
MMTLSRVWPFLIALALLTLDFITKRVVLGNIETFARGIPLIEGVLRFTYVRNSGAAFGLFEGGRWPFVAVSVGAAILLSLVLARGGGGRLRRTAYALILAGAAGNLIDRIFYGGRVVDFIEMGLRGRTFPVYNVADMGVSIGAALLILSMLLEGRGVSAPAQEPAAVTPAAASDDAPGRSEA